MLYSWVTTHTIQRRSPCASHLYSNVLKKLVGVTQLYVRGLVMDRDDDLSVEVRPTWRQARCAGCGRRAPQYDHPRSVGRWQDLNWGPVRIYLVYRCRRVTCARCGGRPCNELVPWAAAGTKCTHRMEELTAFLARHDGPHVGDASPRHRVAHRRSDRASASGWRVSTLIGIRASRASAWMNAPIASVITT